MVSIIRRMTKLRALLSIRVGPGAAILPAEVSRIHLDFAFKLNDGHLGPRKFWRAYLPRLKYYNPAVLMSVNRTIDQAGPAQMTIHFTDSLSTSTTNAPPSISSTTDAKSSSASMAASRSIAPTERTAIINMKHRHETEILSQLMLITKAIPVEPSESDLESLRELEEQRKQSLIDSKRSQTVNEKKKQREAVLAQARGQIAAAKEEG